MNNDDFMTLYKAGKFREALALATAGHEKAKYAPTRYGIDKKTGKPRFFRGNKGVELTEDGEWQLFKGPAA